jgi:hypothetical protein
MTEPEITIIKPGKMPRGTKYPWRQLEPMQGFFVPGKTHSQLSGTLALAQTVTGGIFRMKTTINKNGQKGILIWREQ